MRPVPPPGAWLRQNRGPVAEVVVAAAIIVIWAWLGRRVGWTEEPLTDISTAVWPFYLSTWDTRTVWSGRALAPMAGLLCALLPLRAWVRREGEAAVALTGLALAAYLVHLGLGIQRYGVEEGLRHSFGRGVEYWADARLVGPGFLARFPEGVGRLSLHGRTHPPGPLLLLAAARSAGFSDTHDAEALVSTAAALSALALYGAARRLADEEIARWAVPLFLFACSVSAFAVASMESVTMLLAATALYGFSRALAGEAVGGVLWGLAFAAATLFSFTAATLGLTYAALLLARRRRLDRAARVALAVGPAVFLVLYGTLIAGFGYRPLHVFAWCWKEFAVSANARRPAVAGLVGGPVAFLGALGLPLAGLAGRAVGGAVRRAARRLDTGTALLVLAGVLPVAVCIALGAPRGEVEHVFLLFVPAVVLGAAAAARRWYPRGDAWLVRFAVPALVVQSILIEVCFDTYW